MTGDPLFYLLTAGLRNRVRSLMRRSRGPQHAIALIVGLAYFGFLGLSMIRDSTHGRPQAASPAALLASPVVLLASPVFLAALVGWWWIRGGFENALAFSPAEVQLLFPAPITRRRLIRYKIVREQAGVLLAAAMLVLFTHGAPLAWPLRLLGAWLLAGTARLHQLASSLIRAGAARHGRAGLRTSVVGVAVMALVVTAVVGSGVAAARALQVGGTQAQAVARTAAALKAPFPGVALLPFRLLLAPLVASDGASFLRALPAAILLAAIHYVWLLRTDAAFEEAALVAGIRRAKRLEAYRRTGSIRQLSTGGAPRRTPLPLATTGRPAGALAWKNGVTLLRQEGVRMGVVLGAVIIVGLGIGGFGDHRPGEAADVAMALTAGVAGFVTFFATLGFRCDLRADLDRIAILRTFPIPPRQLVAAELAAPAIGLYLMQLVAMLSVAVLLPFSTHADLWPVFTAALASAALLLPALDILAIGSQNALAVLYPGWVRIGAGRRGGIDVQGQQMLSLAATGLVLFSALALAAVVGGWAALQLGPGLGPSGFATAAVLATLALYVETAAFVLWLGDRYAALDPAAAGLLGS